MYITTRVLPRQLQVNLVPIYESGFVKPGGAGEGKQVVLLISLAVGVGRFGPVRPTFREGWWWRLLPIS